MRDDETIKPENVKPIKPGITIEPPKDPLMDLFGAMQGSFGALQERDSPKGRAWEIVLRLAQNQGTNITISDINKSIDIAFEFEKCWRERISNGND